MAEQRPRPAPLVDGMVLNSFAERDAATTREDAGPLAAHATRVFNVQIETPKKRRYDVYLYDSF